MSDPTPRVVETACHCAGRPHERDSFTLPAELPPRAGIAAASAMYAAGQHGDLAGALVEAILYNGGISAWNLVDDEGTALPLTPDNVAARVTWTRGATELSNAIFDQYVTGNSGFFSSTNSQSKNGKFSRAGRTAGSTSRKTSSSDEPPAPSA